MRESFEKGHNATDRHEQVCGLTDCLNGHTGIDSAPDPQPGKDGRKSRKSRLANGGGDKTARRTESGHHQVADDEIG